MILYPFTKILPEAVKAIEPHMFLPVYTGGSEYAYWNTLSILWGVHTLVIIEQDIVVNPDSIQTMLDCPEDWCCYTFPVWGNGQWHYDITAALGCSKFSRTLQSRFPLNTILTWRQIEWITKPMWDGGVRPHVHGVVQHRHDYAGELQSRKPSQTRSVPQHTSGTQPSPTP